jgi:tRNA(Arg) A34 adenosine deaminase TadA
MELAKKVAMSGNHHRQFRHGAVLISNGGSVVSFATNNEKTSAFVERFYTRDSGNATRHAECNCILNINPSLTRGGSIYVARVNRTNQVRMSKPCELCQAVLKFCKIRYVYYTTNEDTIERMRL